MAEKMQAIMKTKPAYGAELVEVDVPKPGPGEVLIKVLATSICGTDLHIYEWNEWAQSRIKPPQIMGHEVAGEVVEVGPGVEDLRLEITSALKLISSVASATRASTTAITSARTPRYSELIWTVSSPTTR